MKKLNIAYIVYELGSGGQEKQMSLAIKSLLDNIGIKTIGSNDDLRFVTHRHITKKHIEIAANRINKMVKEQISSLQK